MVIQTFQPPHYHPPHFSLASLSPSQMWLTFSPVPTLSASFYHITVGDVDWFSNSYFAASLLVGFFSIWVLDTFQLRVAVSRYYDAMFISVFWQLVVISTCVCVLVQRG